MKDNILITGNKIYECFSSISKSRETTASEKAKGILHAEEVTLTMKEVV